MEILNGAFYVVDDKFFEDFPDPYLKNNKDEKRPFFYCLSGREGLYWMVPLTSQPSKIALAKRKARQGKIDIFHLTHIGHREGVMLIADMLPVTQEYIKAPYQINGIAVVYSDDAEIALIRRKASKVLTLLRKGVHFSPTQPDVLTIEAKLLSQMKLGQTTHP